ncbi:hypothetical protein AB0A69_32220 [Streptomyces sp. NPDC045431]|uniref:hypothetical protein n=1 Tax=Streptomyces sp. NPDC045431 TaxID=3155613 RepID=UPI0033F336DD
MEWTTLASTVVGAAIATFSGALLDRRRWHRDRLDRGTEVRRVLYGEYLARLSEARNACGRLARGTGLDADARRREAREAFEPCVGLRYQMTITAPGPVVEASERVFRTLRDLRDTVADGARADSDAYDAGRERYNDRLMELRAAMRKDLGADAGV